MAEPLSAPVLLVEHIPALQVLYRNVLTGAGIALQVAASGAEALRLFHALHPKVILLELALPDRDGQALLSEFMAVEPDVCIVLMSAQESVDRAVDAMRAGAFDFLLKPFDEKRLIATTQAAIEAAELSESDAHPQRGKRRGMLGAGDQSVAIGSSPAMQKVQQMIGAVAKSNASIFITGESGTGKELAAYALHQQSSRAKGPFIALNCGAIPHDLLESEVFGHMRGSFTGAIADNPGAAVAADGGTLFLDEICEMAPALQTKFLRFLQNSMVQPIGATKPRKVDVRIISATNRDPMAEVSSGQFREDLFYRLHVVPLHLPPLRQRGRDIIEIAEAALRRYGREEGKAFSGFSAEAETQLLRYPWPGNIRQLLNVVRNIAVLHAGGEVSAEMLPVMPARPATPAAGAKFADDIPAAALNGHDPRDPFAGLTLAELEQRAIKAALTRHQGSVPKAARDLDISLSTLYRRIDAWGLKA